MISDRRRELPDGTITFVMVDVVSCTDIGEALVLHDQPAEAAGAPLPAAQKRDYQ
jgi:hypothetical protein